MAFDQKDLDMIRRAIDDFDRYWEASRKDPPRPRPVILFDLDFAWKVTALLFGAFVAGGVFAWVMIKVL